MHKKFLVVFDENDAIIEQIPCDGFNFTQQRDLEKQTKKRYSPQKVTLRFGYTGVSEELFQKTKALLEKTFEDFPEMGEMFVKDRPEFKHLGYNINKKYKGK